MYRSDSENSKFKFKIQLKEKHLSLVKKVCTDINRSKLSTST